MDDGNQVRQVKQMSVNGEVLPFTGWIIPDSIYTFITFSLLAGWMDVVRILIKLGAKNGMCEHARLNFSRRSNSVFKKFY